MRPSFLQTLIAVVVFVSVLSPKVTLASTLIVMSSMPEDVVAIDSPELSDVRAEIVDMIVDKLPEELVAASEDSNVSVLLIPNIDALETVLSQIPSVDRLVFPHASIRLSYVEAGPYAHSRFSLRFVEMPGGDTLTILGKGSTGSMQYEDSDESRGEVHATFQSACIGSVMGSMADAIRKLRER